MSRDLIKLISTGKNAKGALTKTFYTMLKNKKLHPEKMTLSKFDPRAFNEKTGRCGMHCEFVETKI